MYGEKQSLYGCLFCFSGSDSQKFCWAFYPQLKAPSGCQELLTSGLPWRWSPQASRSLLSKLWSMAFWTRYFFSFHSTSLSLAGNVGHFTWLRHSSCKSSATHSCWCMTAAARAALPTPVGAWRQLQEQRYPLLLVHAVLSCVQIMAARVWDF